MQIRYSLGWQPELPDHRDWMIDDHPEARRLLLHGQPLFPGGRDSPLSFPLQAPPAEVDLRRYCSPIEDQGRLGSCTAQAGVGLVEFLEKRALGRHVDGSRLFVYKTTRNILGWKGDTGAYVRTTMKALAKFGVCQERYWPYLISCYDDEPTAFCYADAANARTLRYFRLDRHSSQDGAQLLQLLRTVLALGMPVNFGFTVYSYGNSKGEFLYPSPGDRVRGGHAVLAVGYQDNRVIGSSCGALCVRNSWGSNWGEAGYGWLPYDYVLGGLARDFWTIFSQDYLGD